MYNERSSNTNEVKIKSAVLISLLVILVIVILSIQIIISSSFNQKYDNISSDVRNLEVTIELLRSEIKDLREQVELIEMKQLAMEAPITSGTIFLEEENVDEENSVGIEETPDITYDTFDGFPPIPAETPISELETNFIPGMDYRTITNHQSEQWAMQLQSTTNEYGARVYKGYICSAMASYYTHTVGDTFHVILNNGSEFDVICGDFKDDGTDPLYRGQRCRNYDKEEAISVLEFIMDTPKLDARVAQAGIFNNLAFFGGIYGDGGNVISLEKTGHLTVDMSVLNI